MINKEKLLQSDFLDRFLGFMESYSKYWSSYAIFLAKDWVDLEYYDEILSFLRNEKELKVPFTMQYFLYMSIYDFECWQNRFSDMCSLLDEKKALYEEFLTFYE